MKRLNRFLILPVLATTLLVAGCHHEAPEPSDAPSLPRAQVRVTTVALPTSPATAQVVGTVKARTSSVIAAKISGRLTMLKTRIGERVNAGDTLAEIDAGEFGARVDQAEAALENANRDLARFEKLLEQSAVTQSEFDAVETRHRIAQAAAAEARSMLNYTRIEAPFNAVIVRTRADVGDLASPGIPLLELDSIGGLRFETDISETFATNIQIGDELTISIEGLAGSMRVAVSEIAPAADPLSRTRTVRLDLEDMDGLRAGQFGRVEVPVAAATNVWVPSESIVRRGQMEMVFVDDGARAVMRLVKSGKDRDGQTEILSGLKVDERIVSEGAVALRDGQPISIQE